MTPLVLFLTGFVIVVVAIIFLAINFAVVIWNRNSFEKAMDGMTRHAYGMIGIVIGVSVAISAGVWHFLNILG